MDEVSISPSGDAIHATGIRPTYEECIEAMRVEEERLSCKMTDREREGSHEVSTPPSTGQSLGGWRHWTWSRSTSTKGARRKPKQRRYTPLLRAAILPIVRTGPFFARGPSSRRAWWCLRA